MNKHKIDLFHVKLGSDPELFVWDPAKNKPVVAIGMTNGTKENPHPITNEGHCIQVDGVALEFNIPACSTKEEYKTNINFVKNYIQETMLTPQGLVISEDASIEFDDKQLDCPEAQEIGCTPDLNAYALCFNSPEGYISNWRACGGHVHVGYPNPNNTVSIELCKAMDLFLGVGSVLLDKDTKRRELYGKAGAMRFKSFGMEYRVLSNFWIFNDELIEWVFTNTQKAISFVNMGGIITNPEEIEKCINECDIQLAKDIIDDYNIPMPVIADQEELIFEG